eukprot:3878626-Amphidinium_carterae.1
MDHAVQLLDMRIHSLCPHAQHSSSATLAVWLPLLRPASTSEGARTAVSSVASMACAQHTVS